MDVNEPGGCIPALISDLDSRFRHLTMRGLRAQREGAVADAEMYFREASVEADALFRRAVEAGAAAILIAPMAVTIAAQNLAALRNAAGEPVEARTILEGAVTRLIAAAASARTPLALRLNCLRHLRHALHFLTDFDHVQGGCGEDVTPLAERTSMVAAEVIRIAEILRGSGAASTSTAPSSLDGSARASARGHEGVRRGQ